MATFASLKVVSTLPAELLPNALYFVRVGEGFDLYCSDVTGQIAHQVNAVTSVAGKTGEVLLSASDISGLGNSATRNVGTTSGTVAAGDDPRFAGGGEGGEIMPIGGLQWMHPEFVPDEFIDKAQRFVRTGTAVAFEPGGKHDEALAAGLGLYDSVKRVGYADSVYLIASITCVDNVSGTLVSLKNKFLFTPWFNSSGVGEIEFQQHPEVSTYIL